MPVIKRRAVLGFALFAIAGILAADNPVLGASGEISVTATRIPESASSVPAAVTVVTSHQIEARCAKTAADALKTVPGLSVSDVGPDGSQKAVSLRGSTTNEVLILVDGVRVNNPLSGLADLANLPAENIDRIEVSRNPSSALYGSDAVGGVVNIITKKTPSPLRLSLENGSYIPNAHVTGFGFSKTSQSPNPLSLLDAQKASLSWSPQFGPFLLRTGGSFTRAANAYLFLDANGDNRALQNAQLLGGDAFLGFCVPVWGGSLAMDASAGNSQKGTPGSQSSPTLNASQGDLFARGKIDFTTDRFLVDALSLQITLHGGFTAVDFADKDTPANDANHKILDIGVDLQQSATFSRMFTLVYGASAAYGQVQSTSMGEPHRASAAAFVEPVLDWGAFSLRPALRYDYYSDFFAQAPLGGVGATLACAYKINDYDAIKLNLSRSYRVPSFEDLYWPAANGAEGNPNLKPESAYAADLGFETNREHWRCRTTLYARYARDVILWQANGLGIWTPTNYGAGLYPGLETELEADFLDRFKFSANYTLLYSFLLSGGMNLLSDKRIPMTAVHALSSNISWAKDALSWSVTVRYTGLRFLSTANVAYLPAHFTVDAAFKKQILKNSDVYLALDNLFGEQYSVIDGYPMPGAKLRMGIELSF